MLRRSKWISTVPSDCGHDRKSIQFPFAAPGSTPAAAVTAATLRRALIAGVQRVIAGRDLLNRINVFPVADGDTGNNPPRPSAACSTAP